MLSPAIQTKNYRHTPSIYSISIKRDALQWLADMSDGDARIALGNLELVVQHIKNTNAKKVIVTEDIKDGIKVLKQN